MSKELRDGALEYHRLPKPGKFSIEPTKPLANQRDLALAYSPGVAYACEAIVEDPLNASLYTTRGNMVAVVTNGTAVLGLGAIGPLAAKPVMEGKAVLFKKFAGIDAVDIEIDERDPDKLVEIIASLEPSFGAINLEDIKAPECFEIEERLKDRMKIPVFHDDQHGTAIVVAAAMLNALRVVGKPLDRVKLVASGAGAAALACLDLLVELGLPRANITVTDIVGVVWKGRNEQMDPRKETYAVETDARTLAEVISGADIFLGLSAPRVLTAEMVKTMAPQPIIMALANPTPEILPDEARRVRPDAIIATGRSDFPNQVNNVLCFPFVFRGALDVGATTINIEMKKAAAQAIADLAMAEPSSEVAQAYGGQELRFGPEYLIPKPFDPRLVVEVSSAVARAAMESGVATRPIEDFDAYRQVLSSYFFRSGLVMRTVFERAKAQPKRVVYADGEDERVLRAAQIVVDEGFAQPILIGRRAVVQRRIERLGLRLKLDKDIELCDPEDDPRYNTYWSEYHRLMCRRGVTPESARTVVRTRATVIGALMVHIGEADALICGPVSRFVKNLRHLKEIFGVRRGVSEPCAMQALILPTKTIFVADTQVEHKRSPEQIAEMTIMCAEEVRRFGITPKIALLSSSSYGTGETPSAQMMRDAFALVREQAPELEVEGEMQADAAISEEVRHRVFPGSLLQGSANLLITPDLDSGNIAFNLAKALTSGTSVGPVLIGLNHPAHILTPAVSVRGIVNLSALVVVDAIEKSRDTPWCPIPAEPA
ncbi:NADP-dependent malic enzyme [Tistrella mobilis]|uniref:Malic enzyme n=1 Tax=Tistrella mobilis TaxID=171437 RepID=A0A162L593_9PROT|nr:NADP-dependent malic enzyme [Tistrella mobilis]KYO53384.1 malic enzyme [Tistrella mobilis]